MCSKPFRTDHYSITYMEQFCKALHPDLELGTSCAAWFRQAIKRCTDFLTDETPPTAFIWKTMKNFIFPHRSTEIISQKVPISIHPNRLTADECQSLFFDVVNDYVQKAPRYVGEYTTNIMLWQVLYSAMGTMILGCFIIGMIIAYNKYGQAKEMVNPVEELLKPEKRMRAIAKRSLCLAKTELRILHTRMKPTLKSEDILPADGIKVLVLKVFKKCEFFESLVEGKLQSVGKFHRLYDAYKTKSDYKIESVNKAMKFLDNCKKLHLLLMFEDDENFEEAIANEKRGSNNSTPRSLSPSSPRNKPKSKFGCRLEGGSISGTNSTHTNSSKRTISPRCTTSPRSSGVVNSCIPRNFLKRTTSAKKSK